MHPDPPIDRSMPDVTVKRQRLLDRLRQFDSCAVAFSGGVDSAVVAQAAFLAMGERAVAVTAVSPSLAEGELDNARQVVGQIGIRHETIETGELANPAYVANPPDRCYHCKTELYDQLDKLCNRLGLAVIVNGANADDLSDYRPGQRAAGQHGVISPLAENGLSKVEVRQLAAEWGLAVWDKPAAPCLSSRIAYGEEVTPQRLAMIDAAEQFLREAGLGEVRVRYHQGDLARLEVPLDQLPQLSGGEFRARLVARLRELGFRYVALDLEGFRSGSQNLVLPIEMVQAGVLRR